MTDREIEILAECIETQKQLILKDLKAKQTIHMNEGTATIYNLGLNSKTIRIDIKLKGE